MSELKPCPFCGAAARWWQSPLVKEDPQDEGGRYECSDCGAHTDADYPSERSARAQWNRRATPPRAEVDVDVASRAIDNAILLASVYDGVAIDKDKVIADLAALRRALARATGGNDAT